MTGSVWKLKKKKDSEEYKMTWCHQGEVTKNLIAYQDTFWKDIENVHISR